MPHQKFLLIAIWIGLISTITTLGWNFPLDEVARPECKSAKRDELSQECKVDILSTQNDPTMSALLFSALRGTSYDTPQKADSGGHPSLDMPTAAGTPVYAIQDGLVMNASEKNGYGLSVTIKHSLDGKTIYSNYSHLSEILVKKGDSVKGGAKIGKVGCTGFSISGDPTRCGNHLDFQITTDQSPSHPYGYGDCKSGYMDAVYNGACHDKMLAYTIDPLVFFNTYTTIKIHVPIITGVTPAKSTTSTSGESKPAKPKKSLKELFSRLKLQNKPQTTTQTSTLATAIHTPQKTVVGVGRTATVDGMTISREWNTTPTQIITNKIVTLTVTIHDKLGNPISGALAKSLSVKVDNFVIGTFFPDQFSSINAGKKHLFFESKQAGSAKVSLRWGETKIGEEAINIQ